MTMAVLGAYTWAILQFTLMTTATIKDKSTEVKEEKEKTKKKISLNLGHYNKVCLCYVHTKCRCGKSCLVAADYNAAAVKEH